MDETATSKTIELLGSEWKSIREEAMNEDDHRQNVLVWATPAMAGLVAAYIILVSRETSGSEPIYSSSQYATMEWMILGILGPVLCIIVATVWASESIRLLRNGSMAVAVEEDLAKLVRASKEENLVAWMDERGGVRKGLVLSLETTVSSDVGRERYYGVVFAVFWIVTMFPNVLAAWLYKEKDLDIRWGAEWVAVVVWLVITMILVVLHWSTSKRLREIQPPVVSSILPIAICTALAMLILGRSGITPSHGTDTLGEEA